jgi:hypothetical protein
MIRSLRLSGTLTLFLLGLSALVVSAAEDTDIKTNLELLSELTNQVATDLITNFQAELGYDPAVLLSPGGDDENYTFITNELTAALWSLKIKSFPPGTLPVSDSTGTYQAGRNQRLMKLEFQALEFRLAYPKIYRAYLIGGKQVERRADVKIHAKLLDPVDESVVWVGEASRSHKDKFPYGDRSEMEEGLFGFTKPPIDPPNWGRIIEPVVVSGIIVGLVYLFYSNQNDQ